MQKDTPKLCRVELDLGPIWDTRGTLQTIVGVIGAAIYLSRPDEPDTEKADVIVALITVQEQLAECADALDSAIKNMKITTKEEARS